MKVTRVTYREFRALIRHYWAALFALMLIVELASCHRRGVSPAGSGVADSLGISLPRAMPGAQALTQPPLESVWLRLPPETADVPSLIRKALFNAGLQATADNRREQWVRASLGGLWEDPYRYRQWYVVVTYASDGGQSGVTLVVRGIEQLTTYMTPAGRASSTGPLSSGFTSRRAVSDAMSGESRSAWLHLERLALALTDQGAELLTDFSGRRRINVAPN